ncbi:hypothetical protein SAMN06295905_1835 [Devosia lucknowensis]|uniref:Uncharacterized protein n=2 Tax=Devosia lucknowensis TaxID=1096929 RepID=A0A1Y6FBR4_9HYPH|nr:hypothetical protein SAMN06295905_1835 [Devosia lucknowensis]
MPVPVLLTLTMAPVALIGATLWLVSDIVPTCSITEFQRMPAPDGAYDLVTFTRTCGDTPENMQAALVPLNEQVPFDAASFVSVLAAADLEPGWTADGEIGITLPDGAEILRQDTTVAGIDVIYR